ncbi:MAG: histidinol-phosphate transaminase [Croceibacterium sp.]
MDFNRRAFIAGTAVLAGAAAATGARATAAPVAPGPIFGPMPGQAQLSRNENPYGPAPSAVAAITDSCTKGCYYADRGLKMLTEMIAERHGLTPDHVVVGSGSTELLSAIALSWGSKGTIVCPELFWDTTVQYGEQKGAKAIRVPLTADMRVDLAGMQAALTPQVSLVQINNPNNPTGEVLDNAALRRFAAALPQGTTLLLDEAYNELTDRPEGETIVDMVREGKDVIVCRTFSKIYGMAGLRVGYALTTPEHARRISEYIMSFGGNIAGLAGAIASYNDDAFLRSSKAMITEGREMILDAVAKAGLRALPTQTNFVFVEVADANAVQKAMAAKDILIRGTYGKWARYSRVSTGKLEDVARYAAALPEVVGV